MVAVDAAGFEGDSSFGVGTRARLPFRVFTLRGPGGHGRIVLDVAHDQPATWESQSNG